LNTGERDANSADRDAADHAGTSREPGEASREAPVQAHQHDGQPDRDVEGAVLRDQVDRREKEHEHRTLSRQGDEAQVPQQGQTLGPGEPAA
jgi:hypothetical protein